MFFKIFFFRPDWNTAKQVMADVNFLKRLQEYDANNIPDAIIKKLKPYVENKDFQPAVSIHLKLQKKKTILSQVSFLIIFLN